jgi:hypothetical protein
MRLFLLATSLGLALLAGGVAFWQTAGSDPSVPAPTLTVVEEPLATATPTAFVEATVVEEPLPEPSTVTPTPIPYVQPPLDVSPSTLEDELARLAEECQEKGILPPPITPEIIPATPPWLVTPTPRPSPEEELRANLNAFPANRKLVISEDIIAVKGFAVLPEEEDDPAKFSQDNIVSGIHHIGSGVSITVDHQGRETPYSIASRSADARESLDPARRVVVEEGIAELERVLADPAIFAMIVEFLAQPLDPCEVYSGLRNSLPEVCLTPTPQD